ncbi:MAG: vitamin B12 ABC transporter permease BtuC [Halobacteriales archaeon]
MRHGARAAGWSAGLAGLLAAVAVVSAGLGPVSLPPATVARALLAGAADAAGLGLAPDVPETARTIVTDLRLPRIALAATVGFALATAGAVMQGFFRNPMADPSIIGVSSGAAVGAVAVIVLPLSVPFGTEAAAFAGALLAAFGVYLIASEAGRTPVATLLLAGVAVQALLGAVVSFMLVLSREGLRQAVYWLMGHLHASTWGDVAIALPVALGGFLLVLPFAPDLNALVLGEEDAHAVGVEVERTKRLLLAAASLVTAIAVSVAGVIGFVGLIVPHVMRLLVGPDHRVLLPASAFAGAVFLVATDTIARLGAAELPVGIVTAVLGAPFFLYLLRDREVYAL